MKVRFKVASAGAGRNIRPGNIVEVSESEGNLLIAKGYAEKADLQRVDKPKKKPHER